MLGLADVFPHQSGLKPCFSGVWSMIWAFFCAESQKISGKEVQLLRKIFLATKRSSYQKGCYIKRSSYVKLYIYILCYDLLQAIKKVTTKIISHLEQFASERKELSVDCMNHPLFSTEQCNCNSLDLITGWFKGRKNQKSQANQAISCRFSLQLGEFSTKDQKHLKPTTPERIIHHPLSESCDETKHRGPKAASEMSISCRLKLRFPVESTCRSFVCQASQLWQRQTFDCQRPR